MSEWNQTVEGRRVSRLIVQLAVVTSLIVVFIASSAAAIILITLDDVHAAASNEQVVQHRVRNEQNHDPICKMLLKLAVAENIDLTDPDTGKPITCPEPITEAELRELEKER